MALLVSAKGSDVLAWRAAGDFAATFRHSLLARLEFCSSSDGEQLLVRAGEALDVMAAGNRAFAERGDVLLEELAAGCDNRRLRELSGEFYSNLYEHVALFRSVAAFYEFSSRFLEVAARSIMQRSAAALAASVGPLPQLKLFALGPAGRQEFSPFCPLQLLLVYGDEAIRDDVQQRLGEMIHEGFAACGFRVDDVITPRNPDWRGSLPVWGRRLVNLLEEGDAEHLIDFFRLSDMTSLYCDEGFKPDFRGYFSAFLRKHPAALAFQVSRIMSLSHGIGIMGGMRFERKGAYRGMFALLENGLQPLSAAVSVLALLKELESSATQQRIIEVLWKRQLNVDMAERILLGWHTLNEFRLLREVGTHPFWSNLAPLHLDVDNLSDDEQASLRESLESVGVIQRHVGLTYSSMEG